MTYHPESSKPQPPHDPVSNESNVPDEVTLEPWMLELAREATDELDATVEVPRDMMWARIAHTRSAHSRSASGHHVAAETTAGPSSPAAGATVIALPLVQPLAQPVSRWSRVSRQVAGLAAMLVAGVAIGRFALPSAPAGRPLGVDTATTIAKVDSLAQARRDDPAHVAMQEHLARTVSLLTTVGDGGAPNAAASLTPLAKELLSTTRLLLDQPQLRDERTRRLLQDLELVLVQVIQARGSAPETQRAPQETLQETDLLTRVRAVVTASAGPVDAIYGGD